MDPLSFRPKYNYPSEPLTGVERWHRTAWLDISSEGLKEILEREPITNVRIRTFLLEEVCKITYFENTHAMISPSDNYADKWHLVLGIKGNVEDIGKRIIH